MSIENEVQSSLPNLSNHVDDNDDDLNSLLIEMYHELEKITKKYKELKSKIDNLSNENAKLVCENKTFLESLEVVKKGKSRIWTLTVEDERALQVRSEHPQGLTVRRVLPVKNGRIPQ
ncbi:hypothetical protein M9H77_02960 [Catharanthus roseus]|uniref:Uncharacterized protein n=1 Tax=Catharanthus roseus TaxID=4058 RepID=A0ACC0CA63_CATRO|nr:hypothetical protein M9H77_02960 [Catharanthus roseus]